MTDTWQLDDNRYFGPDPSQRELARRLYGDVCDLPLVCPHGHVNPALLSDPNARFGTPADLFIIPDHYVFRMLYSRGTPLEELGIRAKDGSNTETDHRKVWQRFAESFYLFRGTPTGQWIKAELIEVFGITSRLNGENAQQIYDELEEKLTSPEYTPRALFERFNVETLCTTDTATASLAEHRSLRDEGWGQRVRPTFRPDAVINITALDWQAQLQSLEQATGGRVGDYEAFVRAIEDRRAYFKEMGATATDQSATLPHTERLSASEAQKIFARALRGNATADDATRFTAHMLLEMARMSSEDGLVMQLHIGSYRNHNTELFNHFGPDMGADIPVQTEWTRNLAPLLNEYGSNPGFRLILFTLDESTYSRELAPLAGHYPALLLGPPWWFYDSPNGMERYLDAVVETTGLYNTAGFNDDTRAFASIPVRHDVWRRVTCNWLAGMVVTGRLDEGEAGEMAVDAAYNLARQAYNLEV